MSEEKLLTLEEVQVEIQKIRKEKGWTYQYIADKFGFSSFFCARDAIVGHKRSRAPSRYGLKIFGYEKVVMFRKIQEQKE